eukprot:349837-Chlamydomonas_euryale.AAC.5
MHGALRYKLYRSLPCTGKNTCTVHCGAPSVARLGRARWRIAQRPREGKGLGSTGLGSAVVGSAGLGSTGLGSAVVGSAGLWSAVGGPSGLRGGVKRRRRTESTAD